VKLIFFLLTKNRKKENNGYEKKGSQKNQKSCQKIKQKIKQEKIKLLAADFGPRLASRRIEILEKAGAFLSFL